MNIQVTCFLDMNLYSTSMWLWSKLSSIKWADAWEERFYGNTNAVISELSTGKSVRVEVYCETEKDALVIQKAWGGSVREVKSQNWVALSNIPRPPIKIRDKVIITAERDGDEVDRLQREFPSRHLIKMPAEMAFGTGDHATTSNCLRFIVDVAQEKAIDSEGSGRDWGVLDLGCGTAVLAIAARMLGASECEAHDFDPDAVRVSKENIKLNGVDKIKVLHQDVLDWVPDKQWPVVVANMFSTILQKAFPTIVKSIEPGGDLIVSGILKDQWDETRLVAEECGIKFGEEVTKGKWVTARGKRSV